MQKFRPLLLKKAAFHGDTAAPIFAQQSQIVIHLRRQTEDLFSLQGRGGATLLFIRVGIENKEQNAFAV